MTLPVRGSTYPGTSHGKWLLPTASSPWEATNYQGMQANGEGPGRQDGLGAPGRA
jgi:hypothetical protein